MSAEDDAADRGQHHYCVQPVGQARYQVDVPVRVGRALGEFAGLLRQFGQFEQRNDRQHRNNDDVLEQQNRKGPAAALGSGQALLVQGLQHDRGRRQRQDHADGQRQAPVETECERNPHHRRRGDADLQSAEPEQARAHRPEHARFQFEADQEQHHDHTEFGKVFQGFGLLADQPHHRADDDAGNQVTEHRAEAESLRQRHRDDRGAQINESLDEIPGHAGSPSRPAKQSFNLSAASSAPMSARPATRSSRIRVQQSICAPRRPSSSAVREPNSAYGGR